MLRFIAPNRVQVRLEDVEEVLYFSEPNLYRHQPRRLRFGQQEAQLLLRIHVQKFRKRQLELGNGNSHVAGKVRQQRQVVVFVSYTVETRRAVNQREHRDILTLRA